MIFLDGIGDGDFVNDTPQHLSKPLEVNCHTNSSKWDTCPNISGIDPVNNYMSKSQRFVFFGGFTTT
jgi:hypothetical protein